MRRPKFVVHQGKDGQWYVRLVAANGQILMASEGYTRKGNADRAAKTIQRTVAGMSTWLVGTPYSPPLPWEPLLEWKD